jgi:hypothetical protein
MLGLKSGLKKGKSREKDEINQMYEGDIAPLWFISPMI